MFALIWTVRASIRYEIPANRPVSFSKTIDQQIWHGSLAPSRGAILLLNVSQPNIMLSAVSAAEMSVIVREGPNPESWRTFNSSDFVLSLGPNSTGGVVAIYNFEAVVHLTSLGVADLGCSALHLVNTTRLRFEEFKTKTSECFITSGLSPFVVVGHFENAAEIAKSNVTFAHIKKSNASLEEVLVGDDGHYFPGPVSPLFVVSGKRSSGFLVTVDVESTHLFGESVSLVDEFVCYNASGEVPLVEMVEEPVFDSIFVTEDKGIVKGSWIAIIVVCSTVACVGFVVMVIGVVRLGKALKNELRRARGAREHSATGGWRLAS